MVLWISSCVNDEEYSQIIVLNADVRANMDVNYPLRGDRMAGWFVAQFDVEVLFPAEVNLSNNPGNAGDLPTDLYFYRQGTPCHICTVRQASGVSLISNGVKKKKLATYVGRIYLRPEWSKPDLPNNFRSHWPQFHCYG